MRYLSFEEVVSLHFLLITRAVSSSGLRRVIIGVARGRMSRIGLSEWLAKYLVELRRPA